MCMNNEKILGDASCSLPKRKNETYLGILFLFPCNTRTTSIFGFTSFEICAKHTNRTDKAFKDHNAVSSDLKTHLKSRKCFYLSGSNVFLLT